MLKRELAKAVGEVEGLSIEKAASVIETLTKVIKKELVNGNDIKVDGLGTFKVKDRAERNGINPATKEPLIIPATRVVTFKVTDSLKKAVKA